MLAAEIEIERAPVVTDEELCKSVDEIFRNMPLLRAVVVVDNEMKPVGLIPRSDFLLQLSQRFGRARPPPRVLPSARRPFQTTRPSPMRSSRLKVPVRSASSRRFWTVLPAAI